MSVSVFAIDPLMDRRWGEFVDRAAHASVFHSAGWLDALKRTYGYQPIALTTTGNGPLENGLPVCCVATPLARRLVSLPFSDHCQPLVQSGDELAAMLAFLRIEVAERRWHSVELRPRSVDIAGVPTVRRYCLHSLDLSPPVEQVFKALHSSSTQRAIRRAEREGLCYEVGTSERLLSSFYPLFRLTRRRHGLPPQPLAWFRNLVSCLGEGLRVHLAIKDDHPIAGLLTLSFRRTMVYKYGASDAAYHRLGVMPFLFWHAIQQAKADGLEELDLGRSDLDQPGLIAFKDHLGAERSNLAYYTWPERRSAVRRGGLLVRAANRVLAHFPDAALDLTGRLLYKHIG